MYDLNENGHETDDLMATIRKSKEWGDRIPIGIFYKNPEKMSYEQQSRFMKDGPLVKRHPDPWRVEKVIDSFL